MSISSTQSASQSQATIAALEKRLSEQQKIIDDQQHKLTEQQVTLKDRESLIVNKEVQIHKLVQQLSQLHNAHFGSSSERYVPTVDPRQLKLDFFNEAELLAALTSGSCSANILLTVPTATDCYRLLPTATDCYRLERPFCWMGLSPTEERDLSTAH